MGDWHGCRGVCVFGACYRECTRTIFLDWHSRTLCWMECQSVQTFQAAMWWNKSMESKQTVGNGQIFGFSLAWYLHTDSFSSFALSWRSILAQWCAQFWRAIAPIKGLPEGHQSYRMWLGQLPLHRPQQLHQWMTVHHCRESSGDGRLNEWMGLRTSTPPTTITTTTTQQPTSISFSRKKCRFVKLKLITFKTLSPLKTLETPTKQICTPCVWCTSL